MAPMQRWWRIDHDIPLVEGYWHRKPKCHVKKKSSPVPLCPLPQTPRGLPRDWSRAHAARGPRLNARATVPPLHDVTTRRTTLSVFADIKSSNYMNCSVAKGSNTRKDTRSADKSLARTGRNQADVSVWMAWISFDFCANHGNREKMREDTGVLISP